MAQLAISACAHPKPHVAERDHVPKGQWHVAVDPTVIPLGSRVYIPAYRHDPYGGWFVARDTGGAIRGRHVDVYRTPPARSSDTGQFLIGQRVYMIRPRR